MSEAAVGPKGRQNGQSCTSPAPDGASQPSVRSFFTFYRLTPSELLSPDRSHSSSVMTSPSKLWTDADEALLLELNKKHPDLAKAQLVANFNRRAAQERSFTSVTLKLSRLKGKPPCQLTAPPHQRRGG